jgi:23S rRNA (cytosine1962-C5)-methyltransferase
MMQPVIDHISKGLAEHSDEARRLFHGRGQCFEALGFINVDYFHPVLLVTLYQAPDLPAWQHLLTGLHSLDSVVECVLVQRRYLPGAPTETLLGEQPAQTLAMEQGLQFALSFGGKQNIGFFLDMAPGRSWLKHRADQKRVLNLFSYTCSLSVAAIAGGASSVLNVDMSKAALTVGRDNHRLNGQGKSMIQDVQFLPYDLFRSWNKIIRKGPYDIVVIDPPSRQKGSFVAEKDYARVIRRLPALMPAGGDVLACLNAPHLGDDFLHALFAQECPGAHFVERLMNRADFPESDHQRNLKMLHFSL